MERQNTGRLNKYIGVDGRAVTRGGFVIMAIIEA